MRKKVEEPEITIDAESGEEIVLEEGEVAASKLQSKLKKLRDELKVCKTERAENLAGWQRAKADMVNHKRVVNEERSREKTRTQADLIRTIIPALDSFESAMMAESWKEVDGEWREGVERIATQLHKSLEEVGLSVFGKADDVFDPTLHECMSVMVAKDVKKDGTIAQVLQRGYKIDTEIVRPAKVVVAQAP